MIKGGVAFCHLTLIYLLRHSLPPSLPSLQHGVNMHVCAFSAMSIQFGGNAVILAVDLNASNSLQ